jgi:hypothetical protein
MTPEVDELLSAFVDGERVSAPDLAVALSEPGAREALIDFIRLRTAMDDHEEPSVEFARKVRRELRGHSGWRPVRLAAAAAVLALSVLGLVDVLHRMGRGLSDEPPHVARVIRYEPGVDWIAAPGR